MRSQVAIRTQEDEDVVETISLPANKERGSNEEDLLQASRGKQEDACAVESQSDGLALLVVGRIEGRNARDVQELQAMDEACCVEQGD